MQLVNMKHCQVKLKYSAHVFSGDGGNDVSMIQAADCGIGIEGKVYL